MFLILRSLDTSRDFIGRPLRGERFGPGGRY
jgi:hypothetical protein